MNAFSKHFSFRKYDNNCQPSFYHWNDPSYSIFMNEFLLNLEPRQELADIVVFGELDEINEVLFFNRG